MNLDDWLASVPRALRDGPLWRVRVYQIGSYIAALAMRDAAVAAGDMRLSETVPQLVEAVGSIPANVGEGYARRSRADRIRYYEYAMGSANEAQSWYMGALEVLGETVVSDRLEYLARVRQLLLVMIAIERKGQSWGSTRRIPKPPRDKSPDAPTPAA